MVRGGLRQRGLDLRLPAEVGVRRVAGRVRDREVHDPADAGPPRRLEQRAAVRDRRSEVRAVPREADPVGVEQHVDALQRAHQLLRVVELERLARDGARQRMAGGAGRRDSDTTSSPRSSSCRAIAPPVYEKTPVTTARRVMSRRRSAPADRAERRAADRLAPTGRRRPAWRQLRTRHPAAPRRGPEPAAPLGRRGRERRPAAPPRACAPPARRRAPRPHPGVSEPPSRTAPPAARRSSARPLACPCQRIGIPRTTTPRTLPLTIVSGRRSASSMVTSAPAASTSRRSSSKATAVPMSLRRRVRFFSGTR